jgi:hypothetical protein
MNIQDLAHLARIEKITTKKFVSDVTLQKQITNIVSPSYEDSTTLLAREIKSCNEIYLAKDQNQQIHSFFMIGWSDLVVDNQQIPAVYLGLSATSATTKNRGYVRLLFEKFFKEAYAWEEKNQQKLVLWHTTASPSIFHAFNLLLDYNEPDKDGDYTDAGQKIALAICQKKGWQQNVSSQHPFVLHGVAENTLYSKEEFSRLGKICQKNNFTLFNQLNINERKGDRLLRISRLSPQKYPNDPKTTF